MYPFFALPFCFASYLLLFMKILKISRKCIDTQANCNARIPDKTISHLTEICVALTGKVRDRRAWKGFHATTCPCETEVDLPNSLRNSFG